MALEAVVTRPIDLPLYCPVCHTEVAYCTTHYACPYCPLEFPIIYGIADFRIAADPYISIEEDRIKGQHLWECAAKRTFPEMLDYYYSITPEDPPALAVNWISHARAEQQIGADYLTAANLSGQILLDIGCSTAGMVVAASRNFEQSIGIDCAFRWLAIGRVRLRELGIDAPLICANAEALPFAPKQFDAIVASDVIEHVPDVNALLHQVHRALAPNGTFIGYTNNRYSPLPDPQVGLFGVGLLPRRWQAPYVAMRCKDLHRYNVAMRSAPELKRMLIAAGFTQPTVTASLLSAPHKPHLAGLLKLYNRIIGLPVIGEFSAQFAPRLFWRAQP